MKYTKTINDAQLSLAYRLGESAVPTTATELARRLDWFRTALSTVLGGEEHFWFMQDRETMATEANKPRYSIPDTVRKIIQLKIDDYKYDEIPFDEKYAKYETPMSPVPILPAFMARGFYQWGEEFFPIPIPDSAPASFTPDSITSSGTTCTVTYATGHGYFTDDYITIAGAAETAYNGTFRITVVSDSVFTYTALSTPSATPATGTLTMAKDNIEIMFIKNLVLPTSSSSPIVIPDDYLDIVVSYGEGRYWSYAHKRAKSADAFTEFEKRVNDLRKENFRRKYLAQ